MKDISTHNLKKKIITDHNCLDDVNCINQYSITNCEDILPFLIKNIYIFKIIMLYIFRQN